MIIITAMIICIFLAVNVNAACWPPGAQIGGAFNLTDPGEAAGVSECIELPDNFTIRVDPKIGSLNLNTKSLKFGKDCTIDLSGPNMKPNKAPNGNNAVGQPPWGEKGNPGGQGISGVRGKNGSRLQLTIEKVAPQGSLWIKTDGQPGGDGGDGGNGGLGGGSSCGKGEGGPHTNAGDGGDGGKGGDGGRGGDTAEIILNISYYNKAPELVTPPSIPCGPSNKRPASASVSGGSIVVYGQPGCGGQGGSGGAGGPTDRSVPKRECGWTTKDVFPGADGAPGNPGSIGQPGTIGKIQINPKK